ncbi:MAG: radical SAM family heme chaperone HemW, partial [Eggerthellaceae bacterium]|nr:radical SAM family heme chaperone HemW [Eggerthellaceae bacterium]
MPHDPYKALYIHIPYCVSKCIYCDFKSYAVPCSSDEIDSYVERLISDIRKKANEGELSDIKTIYIGGGTPSHIGNKRLCELIYAISLFIDLSDVEFSMEANPESLTEAMVKDIYALGVNRLSLGVQSFDDDVLKFLGRAHDAQRAKEAIDIAKSRFSNISIDLMCGIPGQSLESFIDTVKQAISCDVAHMSVYPLSIEQHTPLDKLVMQGKVPEPDSDVQARQMIVASELLKEAGYERYEVASYAKPGFECKHNTAYWTGVPYLGLGMSAATMTQNQNRRMRMIDGEVSDDLGIAQMKAEDLMMGMRMTKGMSDNDVASAVSLLPELPQTLDNLIEKGLIEHTDGRYRPTQQGWLC